jgi:hypothetical protein
VVIPRNNIHVGLVARPTALGSKLGAPRYTHPVLGFLSWAMNESQHFHQSNTQAV